MAFFASPGAVAATKAPSRPVSAAPITPRAIGTMHPVRATAAPDQVYDSMLQDVANSYCLNGTLALVYLTPCNDSDLHMWWEATEYDVDGYLAYTLMNLQNDECLNGALVTSHAQVTLTPCSSSDNHMLWYPLGNGSGIDEYEDAANGYCLNGALVTSHAQVTLTPCNASDNHMSWKNDFPY
jgi:hypothetical protein